MTMIRMLQNKVLVEPIEEDEEKSESVIVVPKTITTGTGKGRIVAIGESKLRVGDTVLYSVAGSFTFKHDQKDLLVISENQIFASL